MTRSKWKSPFVDYNLFINILKKKKYIKTRSRSTIILPNFIGLTISVYNGCRYKNLHITEKMIGHKLGEFVFTRKVGKIHTINKKK